MEPFYHGCRQVISAHSLLKSDAHFAIRATTKSVVLFIAANVTEWEAESMDFFMAGMGSRSVLGVNGAVELMEQYY